MMHLAAFLVAIITGGIAPMSGFGIGSLLTPIAPGCRSTWQSKAEESSAPGPTWPPRFALGTFWGVRLLRRIDERTFLKLLFSLMLVLGVYMLIHGANA